MIDLEKLRKSKGHVLAIVNTQTGEYEPVSEEVQQVRHGHWIVEWETDNTRMLRCSECRMVFNVGKGRDGNYCPECGAKMDEVEHSQEDDL